MSDSIVYLDKVRSRRKRQPIVTQQEEANMYISELTDEFKELLNHEMKGGKKNEYNGKNDSKRT